MLSGEEEYQPIIGSSSENNKKHAYIVGGGAAILVLCVFAAFSGSSVPAVPQAPAVMTQAAVQAPAAVAQAPVAQVPAPVAKVPAPVAQAAPVAQVAPVAQPAAPVAQPAAPVAQPAAPVAQPAAPVAQPAAPVAQPAAPVAQAATLQTQTATVQAQVLASGAGSDEVVHFSTAQFDFIYNILSFAIAAMGASTVFFFFQFSLVAKKYRTAMIITALVTLIAFYHYVRIFNSFNTAYVSDNGEVTSTGIPFNDAYRYVDWLLTVPLLLMELILVMDLGKAETRSACIKLGGAAALMIVLGYPGEINNNNSTRWAFWAAAMAPFLYIVWSLFVGLSGSVANQPEEARGLVDSARWVTVLSWCTYPVVYTFPMLGLTGAGARTGIQVGYSIADVIAKPLLGLVVWQIAARKSKMLS